MAANQFHGFDVEPLKSEKLVAFPTQNQYPTSHDVISGNGFVYSATAIMDYQFHSEVMGVFEDGYFPFPNYTGINGAGHRSRDLLPYDSLDIVLEQRVSEKCTDCNHAHESGSCFFDELRPLFHNNKPLLLPDDHNTVTTITTDVGENEMEFDGVDDLNFDVEERNPRKRSRLSVDVVDQEKLKSSMLSFELVSQHFYMPITQAAKEMNVGLTLLKKRCRELGIRRWPHRKLMSLQTLIGNIKDSERVVGEESRSKYRYAIEIVEGEKKEVERWPDKPLGKKTKRLRQVFFKANYKKRRMMSTIMESEVDGASSSFSSGSSADFMQVRALQVLYDGDGDGNGEMLEEEDEEVKFLLMDSSSPQL